MKMGHLAGRNHRLQVGWAAWVALVFWGGLSVPAESEVLSRFLNSMVRIEVIGSGGATLDADGLVATEYEYATGFYISEDGHILTAAHSIRDRSKIDESPIACQNVATGETFGVFVVFEDLDADLAVLKSPLAGGPSSFVDLSQSEAPMEGRGVYCLGVPDPLHHLSERYTAVSVGSVIAESVDLRGASKMRSRQGALLCDCEASPGLSGGLILDEGLHPIGIILGIVNGEEESGTYARRLDGVTKFLEKQGALQ